MHKVAWELGKSLEEVKSWQWEDILQWTAYFQIVQEEQTREMERRRRSGGR